MPETKSTIRIMQEVIEFWDFFGAIGLLQKIYHFECDSRLCDWLLGAVPTARVESIHYVVTKTICARPRCGGMQAKAVYVMYAYNAFFFSQYFITLPSLLRKERCWGVMDFFLFSFLKIETIFHNSPNSPQANSWIIPEMRPQQTASFPHPSRLIIH